MIARVRATHWSVRLAAALGALAVLLGLGPIAVAVLMLRCCDDAHGPDAGAWALIAAVLLLLMAAAAFLCAALVAGARRLLLRRRTTA